MTGPTPTNLRQNREAWLGACARLLARDVFEPAGWHVPTNVRFSCSWPSRAGLAPKRRRIGEAWSSDCAADGYFGIMISQSVDHAMTVAAILAHELVHVTVGLECGHRGDFRRCALNIGLDGPMTATVAGEAFKRSVKPILEELGPYPHGAIGPAATSSRPKPQKGRQLKAECRICGLTLRVTRKWLKGRSLACPDMACVGQSIPLRVS